MKRFTPVETFDGLRMVEDAMGGWISIGDLADYANTLETTLRKLEVVKEKLRHHYASGDYDRGHNCRATITLNALRQSLGL